MRDRFSDLDSETKKLKILFCAMMVAVILAMVLYFIRLALPEAGKLCMLTDFVDIIWYMCMAFLTVLTAIVLIKERNFKSAALGVLCGIFGLIFLYFLFDISIKVLKDIGSEPQIIVLENCEYEYRHRSRAKDKNVLKGTDSDGRTYSFDVGGLDKKMLEKISQEKGKAMIKYYRYTKNVLSVDTDL